MNNQNINREEPKLLSIIFSFFLLLILTNEAGLLISILITAFIIVLFVFKQFKSEFIADEGERTTMNSRRMS